MSVLIKGGKMPEYCGECDGCRFDNLNVEYRCFATGEFLGELDINKERGKRCPLVEIPPHGDLIDKNALMESIKETYCTPCPHDGDYNYCKACSIDDALDAIDDTPTVIESEEQEHGNSTTQD